MNPQFRIPSPECRQYPTVAQRLAYIRRATASFTRATTAATAMLTWGDLGPGGTRATAGEPGAVRVYMMNVLRWTATDFETRRRLLEEVIGWVRSVCSGPAVVLTPGGYFGHNSVSGTGRTTMKAGWLDRERVARYLREEIPLPANLLLAVGLDYWQGRQTLVLVQRGGVQEIVRGRSLHGERICAFGGRRFFGVICGEFQRNERYGPMYPEEPRYFDAERDIRGRRLDAVLCAAHIEVKSTQQEGRDTRRFPFETFLVDVSRAGAAGFLAHHHPDEQRADGWPKSNSYSDWAIFAGHQGESGDWLRYDGARGRWLTEEERGGQRIVLG